ncbi:MAG TPA: hypothetical protein VLB01_02455 [Thermodesulfobacteriota bacterium]|nr:hypothetical protein [Thermodesulfobacteriota bacterium]
MIDRVNQIARKEWGNLRHCFEMCGDIGDFNLKDLRSSNEIFRQKYEWFKSNAIEMDKKIPQFGYATPEALNVFTILASRAAEKLGFNKGLAFAFGTGYGFVRTGLLLGNRLEPAQAIFCKLFFPLERGFEWDFDSSVVKTKLKAVFDGFRSWQENPQIYVQDYAESQNTEETWKEWEEVNE